MREFASLTDLASKIRDERDALRYFTAIRWRNGAFCPYCGSTKVYHFKDGKTHKCGDCRQRFSIKVGTIFEGSNLPIRTWLFAMWMITSHKKGIASTQLAKDLKITQKSAWFVMHRLRAAQTAKSYNKPLENFVEADETFIGGKETNKPKSKRRKGMQGGAGKEMVAGFLERGGEFRAFHLPRGPKHLKDLVQNNVREGSNLLTDENKSYAHFGDRYHHYAVKHMNDEYVRDGWIHTNGLEGAWSLLKRQIYGIHHWVSAKHLSRYVSEMTWRYNRRTMGEGERLNALIAGADGRLTYQGLIA